MGGGEMFARFLEPVFEVKSTTEVANLALERTLTSISAIIGLTGIFMAYLLYLRRRDITESLSNRWFLYYGLLREGYYFDRAYDFVWVRPYYRLSSILWKGMDLRVIDGSIHRLASAYERSSMFTWKGLDEGTIDGTVHGIAGITLFGSRSFRVLQTGLIRDYAVSMVIGIVLFIGYFLVIGIF
jgi:NADH-quinone oxidoreductase subunit L